MAETTPKIKYRLVTRFMAVMVGINVGSLILHTVHLTFTPLMLTLGWGAGAGFALLALAIFLPMLWGNVNADTKTAQAKIDKEKEQG